MPSFHYWLTGAAVFLPFSFLITFVIGLVPMMEGRNRLFISTFWTIGFLLTGLGWHSAAEQESNSDIQSEKLASTETTLRSVQSQVSDLILKMNRVMKSVPNQELALLAPEAPAWLKIAHKELGEHEIAGLEENPRIVEYFRTIGAKTYRDDIDDWASAFAEWSLNQTGIKGPKNDDPFSWLGWGQRLDRPAFGCIVVMSFNGLRHVGFYFGEDGDFVLVLGGNEDDAVHIFHYPKGSVQGYRWPPGIKLPSPY